MPAHVGFDSSSGGRRGLVLRLGALGDTLLLEPALAALRGIRPRIDWELIGTMPYAELLGRHLVGLHDGGAARFAPLFAAPRLESEPIRFLTRFERAVVFSANSDLRRHLAEHIATTLCAAPLPEREDSRDVVDYLLDCLEPWIGDPAGARRVPSLPLPAADGGSGAAIVLAPGAGAAAKRWPIDRWAALGRSFGRDLPAERRALLLGPAESDLRDPLADLAQALDAEVWDHLPLPTLAQRLAAARLYIGNDSGPTHLAAAVGCPTLAVFGPASERRWEPRGPRVVTLHASEAQEWASSSRAIAAARRLWAGR